MDIEEDAPMIDLTEAQEPTNPGSRRFVKGGHVIVAVGKTNQPAEPELPTEVSSQEEFEELLEGGEKISLKTALDLKDLCWGSASMSPRNIWLKQGITLNKPEMLFAYGLKAPQNGTKNFLMCVQAYFLKYLLFETKTKGKERPQTEARRQSRFMRCGARDDIGAKNARKGSFKTNQILRPNSTIQAEMVVNGLAEILMKAAEGDRMFFCYPGLGDCFEANAFYGIDGITEKMILFPCEKPDELKSTIRILLPLLMKERGCGLLCFLYSLVLTRNFERIREDLQNEAGNQLIDLHGEVATPLLHLVLFGQANPYLHNGTMPITDDYGQTHERVGIQQRSDIGLLVWEKNQATTDSINIGSRLKTPSLPLWVTRCNNHYGVLFNPNKDLLRTHNAEKRFVLYYFSNYEFKENQGKETKLTIETVEPKKPEEIEFEPEGEDNEDQPLELAIRTKWEDANISWNGTTPFV